MEWVAMRMERSYQQMKEDLKWIVEKKREIGSRAATHAENTEIERRLPDVLHYMNSAPSKEIGLQELKDFNNQMYGVFLDQLEACHTD